MAQPTYITNLGASGKNGGQNNFNMTIGTGVTTGITIGDLICVGLGAAANTNWTEDSGTWTLVDHDKNATYSTGLMAKIVTSSDLTPQNVVFRAADVVDLSVISTDSLGGMYRGCKSVSDGIGNITRAKGTTSAFSVGPNTTSRLNSAMMAFSMNSLITTLTLTNFNIKVNQSGANKLFDWALSNQPSGTSSGTWAVTQSGASNWVGYFVEFRAPKFHRGIWIPAR